MTNLNRYTIKVVGESGQGINSIGELVGKGAKKSGWYTFGYREYPSLIKGGYASHQVDLSDQPLRSASRECDVLLCMSRVSFHRYLATVRQGGSIIHSVGQLDILPDEQQLLQQRQVRVTYVPAGQLAREAGGSFLMSNTVLMGVLWQFLGLEGSVMESLVREEFAKKPDVIDVNLGCLHSGMNTPLTDLVLPQLAFAKKQDIVSDLTLTGNHALALGAAAVGVRAYYAYPMTPSSSILSFMADWYHQTGIMVKQLEDEISVAQMTLGSMFAGTRALCGTSGGGFDLMTETVSLAAMTETPFVCILAQRPGPATGLPTWTSSADLQLAVHAGHGEYTRCVLAASDAVSCYSLIQKAFNIAEKYQIPVIVMTDKQIAEAHFQVSDFAPDEPIVRSLVPKEQLSGLKPSDRFALTESGISPRWLPGDCDATYDANSDEHLEDGSLTEQAAPAKAMYDKRLRKETTLRAELPAPQLIGPAHAALGLVGWGSVKPSVEDALSLWNSWHPDKLVSYLHYEYVWPLLGQPFDDFRQTVGRTVLIEQNATGQLGELLAVETGHLFAQADRLLKYDGRPFFVEDLLEYFERELTAPA